MKMAKGFDFVYKWVDIVREQIVERDTQYWAHTTGFNDKSLRH